MINKSGSHYGEAVWKLALKKERDWQDRWEKPDFDPFGPSPDRPSEDALWNTMCELRRTGSGPLAPPKSPPKYKCRDAKVTGSQFRVPKAPVTPLPLARPFRLPLLGEPVRIGGLRARPHLNGVTGEIASDGTDDNGYVRVRLYGDGAASSSMQVMKVRATCLQPLQFQRSSSEAEIRGRATLAGRFTDTFKCRDDRPEDPPDWASAKTAGSTVVASAAASSRHTGLSGSVADVAGGRVKWYDQRFKGLDPRHAPTRPFV